MVFGVSAACHQTEAHCFGKTKVYQLRLLTKFSNRLGKHTLPRKKIGFDFLNIKLWRRPDM